MINLKLMDRFFSPQLCQFVTYVIYLFNCENEYGDTLSYTNLLSQMKMVTDYAENQTAVIVFSICLDKK